MRHRFLHGFAILITACVFLMSSASLHHPSVAQESAPTGTPANRSLETTDADGSRLRCSEIAETKGGVILGYIVPCVTYTIEGTTERMSQAMIDWLEPTIYAFMTLAVIMFGIRILQGGGQMHGEGILLLLKMGIVIACLELIPHTFVPMLYDVMTDSVEIVSGAIGPDESSIHCDIAKYKADGASTLWAQMDCLVGKLYGITVGDETGPDGEKRPNMLLAASIFGLLGGFLFGGSFGAILFLACVGMLWTMFMVVLRTVVAFLNGYLYASLLLIISPLFLPLILIKASAQYFEPWWKGILGSILLPVIISAYAMFALLLYDKMLFEPPTEGVPGSGSLIHKLFDNELVKKMQDLPRPVCDVGRAGNVAQRAESTGLTEKQLYDNNPFFRNFVTPLLTAANNQCLGIQKPTLEMTRGLNTDSNKEAFKLLFYDCVKLLVLALMINMGYNSITGLARRLIGSGGVASSLDARGPIETKMASVQSHAKNSFIHAFDERDDKDNIIGGTTSGAEFIQRIPSIPLEVAKGIKTGLGS